ncbi:hypothetical protein K4F52_001947 [Lecanicillium sp. MT-2017a]|nr:hypothetical protein K4F52_001947 [Lecanicillium sp. MT-2017a]
MAASVQKSAAGAVNLAHSSLDRVVPPDARQRAYDTCVELASTRPILFSFLSAQLIFSFLPLLLFTIFGASTVAFAVGGAILFALFWIGLGLLVLIPTLFITASIGLLVWAWAAGSFVVVRAVYRRVAAYNNNAAPPGKGGAANGQFKAQNGGS